MRPLMMVERLYFETDLERRFYRRSRLSLFVFDSIDNHLEQVVLLLRRQGVHFLDNPCENRHGLLVPFIAFIDALLQFLGPCLKFRPRGVYLPLTSSSMLIPKYSDSFFSVGRLMFSELRLNHEFTALGLIPHSFANLRREIPFALIRDCRLSVNAIQNSTPFPAKRWCYHVC